VFLNLVRSERFANVALRAGRQGLHACASLPSVVIITTGTPFALSTLASCLMNSSPSITGILISHRMRSMEFSFTAASASAPLLASSTCFNSIPACRKDRSTILRITDESSTISAVMLFIR
jgi:hypothetical protein